MIFFADICDHLQKKNPLPNTGKMNIQENLRSWVSAKLRSQNCRNKAENSTSQETITDDDCLDRCEGEM